MIKENRQTGRTTRQIINAPKDSIYVWCNTMTNIPLSIARSVGRFDLLFTDPSLFIGQRYIGLTKKVIIDHAFWDNNCYDSKMSFAFDYLKERGLL